MTQTATETLASMIETASHLDARGRLITVKRLNALKFYRLSKVMGSNSDNSATMDLAQIASCVTKIDAENIAVPASEREVELLIQRLDFDGLAAAGEALKKMTEDDKEGLAAAKN